jgi:hypothetical protein
VLCGHANRLARPQLATTRIGGCWRRCLPPSRRDDHEAHRTRSMTMGGDAAGSSFQPINQHALAMRDDGRMEPEIFTPVRVAAACFGWHRQPIPIQSSKANQTKPAPPPMHACMHASSLRSACDEIPVSSPLPRSRHARAYVRESWRSSCCLLRREQ